MGASDGLQFLAYVRRRWVTVAVSCVTAMLLAGGVSLIIPPQYTATASILIDPPAGNDPRGATAVSSVYLESLKTYERFASSDTVFVTALQHLGLLKQFGGKSVEAIKRSVLKVSRPTNTKIVEISVTLGDPHSAQRLAQHIAEQTVVLNRTLGGKSVEDVLAAAVRNVDDAGKRLSESEHTKEVFLSAQPVEALEKEVEQIHQLLFNAERELSEERTGLARAEAALKGYIPGDGQEEQARWTRREVIALGASIANLTTQIQELDNATKDKAGILETRKQRREALDTEVKLARANYESAKTKLSDAQSSAAYRGERMEIMDPGIVPGRPSFPNPGLNAVVALVVAFIASIVYLAVRFGFGRQADYINLPEYSIR